MDISADSWTIDAGQVRDAIQRETERNADGKLIHKSSGRRVAAITPVFTMGIPADMDSIMALAKECRLPVIVDGAAALGATYKGRLTGDLGADLTMYSFNGNKIVTAGGGGAVVGHDKTLLDHLRHLTTTARCSADYDHDMVGFNYRMTNIQAAVGCAQMEQLAGFVTAKKSIDRTYRMAFADLPEVSGFPVLDDRESACWFTGFRFRHAQGASHSRALRAALKEAGIDARPFWKPMHLQAPYKDVPRETMTVSDMIWEQIVTLPCSTQLTVSEQAYVIDTVRAWFRDNGLA